MLLYDFISDVMIGIMVVLLWSLRRGAAAPPAATGAAPEVAERRGLWEELLKSLWGPGPQGAGSPSAAPPPPFVLEEAITTYEKVVTGFARGDLAALEPLASSDMLAVMEADVASRRQRGDHVDLTFRGTEQAQIVAQGQDPTGPRVSVEFVSMISSVTRNAAGLVVLGDPARIIRTREIWSFCPGPAGTGWVVDGVSRPAA